MQQREQCSAAVAKVITTAAALLKSLDAVTQTPDLAERMNCIADLASFAAAPALKSTSYASQSLVG